MKKIWGLFAIMLSVSVANASSRTVGIVEIESVEGDESSYAIYATDGQIYEINASDDLTIEQAIAAKSNQEKVTINISEFSASEDILGVRSQVLDIKRISEKTDEANAPISSRKMLYSEDLLMTDYITNFTNESSVDSIFRAQRTDVRKRSQCYNRAHVWAWEMRRFTEEGRKVQPGKMWLYFTKKYIRQYRYKWWFHVAPFVQLNRQDTVMDKKFLRGPVTRREWTDFFVTPRTECPVISRYSQYANNPYQGNCFLMRTSVHYSQPYQMENLEKGKGQPQREWTQRELNYAYKNGVGTRRIPNL